jgi:hypothetical protein
VRYAQQRLLSLDCPVPTEADLKIFPLSQRFERSGRFKYPADATHKTCMRCGFSKPLDQFSPLKNGALGRQTRCKACIRLKGLAYTQSRLEAKAGRRRPDICDCCKKPNTAKGALHFDHDHLTGQFRGWLCNHCNAALGHVNDNIVRLEQLIDYVRRNCIC